MATSVRLLSREVLRAAHRRSILSSTRIVPTRAPTRVPTRAFTSKGGPSNGVPGVPSNGVPGGGSSGSHSAWFRGKPFLTWINELDNELKLIGGITANVIIIESYCIFYLLLDDKAYVDGQILTVKKELNQVQRDAENVVKDFHKTHREVSDRQDIRHEMKIHALEGKLNEALWNRWKIEALVEKGEKLLKLKADFLKDEAVQALANKVKNLDAGHRVLETEISDVKDALGEIISSHKALEVAASEAGCSCSEATPGASLFSEAAKVLASLTGTTTSDKASPASSDKAAPPATRPAPPAATRPAPPATTTEKAGITSTEKEGAEEK